MARAKRTDSKGRVLRVGESQDTDGRYRYKWTSGGERHAISAATLTELRQQEEKIRRDEADGIRTIEAERITLNELFKMFMDSKSDIRETTRVNYLNTWDSAIKDTLGVMKISEIKPIHIKRFYTDSIKRGLAASTVKYYHNLIFPTLEVAVDNDLIRKNPAKGARKDVGGETMERKAMTAEQENNFLEFVRNSERYKVYFPMIAFGLATGLRAGELTGLQWEDVDKEKKIIHIRQQLIYKNLGDGYKFHVGDLKTEAGRRDIPLTDDARKALLKQRELDMYLGKMDKRKEVCGMSDYVFTNGQGMPYAVAAVNFFLKDIVKAYNAIPENGESLLPHISAHILRHTFCTRCAEAGVDPKSLQIIMGHSDIGVTMNTYTHIDFSQLQKQMGKAEGIIKYA